MTRANQRSHARFHLDGLSKVDLPILATYKHVNTIREQVSDNSPNLKVFWCYLVIVPAWCGIFLKLVNRLLCTFAIPFNTQLSVTIHVVAPCCCLWEWPPLSSTSLLVLISFENSFCFIQTDSVIDLRCSLCTSKIYLVKQPCWVFQIDCFFDYCAHIFGMF